MGVLPLKLKMTTLNDLEARSLIASNFIIFHPEQMLFYKVFRQMSFKGSFEEFSLQEQEQEQQEQEFL